MKVGYSNERLHHALHPLFLNFDWNAAWEVGPDDNGLDWYIQTDGMGYQIRDPHGQKRQSTDLYVVKREIYDYYRQKEKVQLPWGIISGIRPTKLARQIFEKNPKMDLLQFQKYIWELDRVSPEKAALLWQVLAVENQCPDLEKVREKEALHLYLGIPYCPSRCYYCSFAAGVADENDAKLADYVELLKTEIHALKPIWENKRIRTIYFGGGTPTVLSARLLEELLQTVAKTVDVEELEEFTVEAGRPDTITADKLEVLKYYGVGRVSINPQTFSDETLARIGRRHSIEELLKSYDLAREKGFMINMDLIFGLNGEGIADVKRSLAWIEKLKPENVTVHTLTPKRGADLSREQKQGIYAVSQEIGQMLDLWHQHMQIGGWRPYYLYRQKNIYFENVGYALPSTECIYNMETMAERQSILALGAGSISKKVEENKISRYDMPKDLVAYRQAVEQGLMRKLDFFGR